MDPELIILKYKYIEEETIKEKIRIQKHIDELEKLKMLKEFLKTLKSKLVVSVIESVKNFTTLLLKQLGEEYEFNVEYVEEKQICKLLIYKEGENYDPKFELGGGVLDLVAIGLRLGLWIVSNKKTPILVLDEPFRFLSRDYKPIVGELFKKLASELDVSIIIITHDPDLIPEESFVFNLKNGGNE